LLFCTIILKHWFEKQQGEREAQTAQIGGEGIPNPHTLMEKNKCKKNFRFS
jgi:hypothetical protein